MRKLLAVFLIVVLVFPLLLATLSVISISSWVLDRNFYEDLLDDSRLYEGLLSEDLPNYFGRRVVREVDSVSAQALSSALREVLTPDYLRSQALRLVDDVFDFIEGRDSTLELYLDIAPIKDRLRGEDGPRFARALAAALPICAAGQESLVPEGSIIRCRPSDVSVEDAAGLITAALPTFLDEFPDRIQLDDGPIDLRREMRGADAWFGLAGQSGLNLALGFLIFLAGSFWLVAALVAGEDRRERLQWLGWSLLVPAGLMFLIGLAITSELSAGWVRFGLNEARFDGFAYSAEFRQALLDISQNALDTIANGFLASGAVSAAIAVALIMWGAATPSERRYAPVVSRAPLATPPAPSLPPTPPPTGASEPAAPDTGA
ncbi:MAG TPA: hypothetical protein VJG32_19840 [Anaerolineae bacterium]|nr:hypothetical protein [Anaerolineae bacterium]